MDAPYGSTGTKRQVGDPAEGPSSNILVMSLVKTMLQLSFLERSMLYDLTFYYLSSHLLYSETEPEF